jgi:hypothetical protein
MMDRENDKARSLVTGADAGLGLSLGEAISCGTVCRVSRRSIFPAFFFFYRNGQLRKSGW